MIRIKTLANLEEEIQRLESETATAPLKMARLLREANLLRPRPTTMLNHEDCYQQLDVVKLLHRQPDVVKLADRLAIIEASLRPPCSLRENLLFLYCFSTQFPSPFTLASLDGMTTPKHQDILRGFRDMRLKTAELDVEYEERGRKRVVVTLADATSCAWDIRWAILRRPMSQRRLRPKSTGERNPGLYVDYANIMAHYHAAEMKRAAEREAALRGFRDMRLKTADLDIEYEERGRKRVVVTLADAVRKPTATKFRKVLKEAFKSDLVRLEYPLGDPPASRRLQPRSTGSANRGCMSNTTTSWRSSTQRKRSAQRSAGENELA
ncbi:hypothetical protein HDU88_000432 [Geranomyces variabilis]|nr:hypothetical protein HDU88_000432 [Geranomyces variabilis]